ncbi:MAG: hypothetical protein KGJ23_12330, partial [Euryarchaeota archaeon]|nr:hypothetical protein [Euryarchaeota archaeon]MDE2046515.1 hypothetical protein [Thermoplasmata archaeon]
RSYGQITDDVQDNQVLEFGGLNGVGYQQDTWKFKAGAWTQCTAASCTGANEPPLTAFGALAYDPPHSDSLVTGGYTGTTINSGAYWTFAADTWTQVSSSNPPGLQSASMAYDANTVDTYIVFFGGNAGNGEQGTTWIFV